MNSELRHPILLQEGSTFPTVKQALKEPNGLLAVGGDLSKNRLVEAYSKGIFPWYSEPDPILWWSPDPRAVLYLADLKVSRSLKKSIRNRDYEIWINKGFSDVVQACSESRKHESGTWITREMHTAYCELHEDNKAHCISVFHQSELVGGLYGVSLGKFFFGESMFSKQRDASKVALVHLTEYLQLNDFIMIDCQVPNPHLESLGSVTIKRSKFINLLNQHVLWQQPEKLWNQQILHCTYSSRELS